MSISPEASVEQKDVPAQRRAEVHPAAAHAMRLLPLVREASERLDQAVAGLDEGTIHQPSRLPGWSRAHLVTHLARNADALVNLLTWARTGVEHPMYASRADRDADIEEGADRLAKVLQEDLLAASERFMVAATGLPPRAWTAAVTTRMQKSVLAAEVPSMRLHEVWVHLVDLDVGFSFAEIPGAHLETLVSGALSGFTDRQDVPSARLTVALPDGRERVWRLGGGHDDRTPEVAGCAADVLAWLTGREAGEGLRGDVPELPAWG